ncbi:DUF3309 family protein [Nocardia sp. NPDC003693]
MQRFLFLFVALIAAASTYDYCRSPGYYPIVAAAGVMLTLLLVERAIR